MFIVLFNAILSILLTGPQGQNTPGTSKQSVLQKVGVTTREFADSSRSNWLGTGPRPLRVIIWYPSDGGGKEEKVQDPSQFSAAISLLHDGKLSATAKYPLIVLSHGSGGDAMQMRWIGYYLSAHGYIAVSVSHSGTDEEERHTAPLTISESCMWERPRDLSAVIDNVLADPLFAARVDTNRIGAAGFSLGGATVIWAAGARLDFEHLKKNAPAIPEFLQEPLKKVLELTKNDPIVQQSTSHSGDSFKDNRIKAVFALAPAIGYGFTPEGLKDIHIPVRIVVGDADIIAPLAVNAKHYADHIDGATLSVLPGELGHYTKPGSGTEYGVELEQVSKLAVEFFKKSMVH